MASGIVILMKSTADLWQKSAQSFRSGAGLEANEITVCQIGENAIAPAKKPGFYFISGLPTKYYRKKMVSNYSCIQK